MRILQLISSGGFYGAEAVASSLSVELPKLRHGVVLGVFHNALIENEETGLLVEPENPQALHAAICRLITDAGLRRRLGTV